MMRFQRVSPDYLPFGNEKKSNLRPATTCKEDRENGKAITITNTTTGFDHTNSETTTSTTTKAFRFKSPCKFQDNVNANSPSPLSENNNQSQRLDMSSPSSGDMLLQWGQKKRARLSRTEIRSLTDDSSSSSSAARGRHPINKVQRRGSGLMDKLSSLPMPPPPPPPSSIPSNGSSTSKKNSGFIPSRLETLNKSSPRLLNLNHTKHYQHHHHRCLLLLAMTRNLEERSSVVTGSPSRNRTSGNSTRAVSRSTATAGKRSPPSPDKIDKKIASSESQKYEKLNGSSTRHGHHNHLDSRPVQSDQEVGGAVVEKVNVEVIEWPRIFVALSRKEKEDDFLAMKGTKLPHRPKKRPKNIDRALQFCFPGMWLADLTKSRYEVREKKSVKKQKRRGLKGMEGLESDSE
ncbi:uncharacterized protein LOC123227785 isoform X2 [Mangifera indica]|uniref:uncharacterized protein LOC123227785 isoform X2 n=1 Tax=Mangifera indica TaxID=29780 RepID=UPI001CFBF476|nr:uncharacterized protein LOC123227785 isoform X2 [Mangifera indica]